MNIDAHAMKRGEDDRQPPPLSESGWSYEETIQQIEATIARIESGELELAAVFDQFAEAVNRLHQCEVFLTERQQQMDVLIETLTDDPDF